MVQIASVLRRAADSESIEIPDEAIALVARSATGSFRDALGTLEQLLAYSGTSIVLDDVLAVLGAADADLLFGTLDAISAGDARSALLAAARLADSGRDLGRFFGDLEAHARGLLVTQVLGAVPAELSVTPEQDERLAEQSSRVGGAEIVRLLELIAFALRAMKDGADPRTQLELALVKAAKPDLEPTVKALQARIARLESARAGAARRPRTPDRPETPAGRAARARDAGRRPPHRRSPRRRAARAGAADRPRPASPTAPSDRARHGSSPRPPPAPARRSAGAHAAGRRARPAGSAAHHPPPRAPAQPAPAHSAPPHDGRAAAPPPTPTRGVAPSTSRRSRTAANGGPRPPTAAPTSTSTPRSTGSRSTSPRRCPAPGTRRPARRSAPPTTMAAVVSHELATEADPTPAVTATATVDPDAPAPAPSLELSLDAPRPVVAGDPRRSCARARRCWPPRSTTARPPRSRTTG